MGRPRKHPLPPSSGRTLRSHTTPPPPPSRRPPPPKRPSPDRRDYDPWAAPPLPVPKSPRRRGPLVLTHDDDHITDDALVRIEDERKDYWTRYFTKWDGMLRTEEEENDDDEVGSFAVSDDEEWHLKEKLEDVTPRTNKEFKKIVKNQNSRDELESLISGVAGYEEDDGEDEDGPCEDIEDSSDDYDEDEDEAYDQSEEEKEEDTFTEEPDVLQDRKQFPSKPPKMIYQSPSAYSPEEEGILTPNVSVTPDFVHDEICATNDPILKMSIESPRGASKNKSYSIDRIISERLTPKSRKSAVRSPNKKDKTFTYSPMKKVETKPSITSKLRLHYESKENDSGSLNRTPVYHSPARTFMSVSPFARSKVLDEITKENFNSLFDDTRSRRSNSVSTDSTSTISSPYKLQNSKPKSARNLYGDYRSRRDQADSFYSSSRDSSHRTLERMDSSEDEGDDFGPRLSLDHTSSDLVTRLDRVRVTDCSRSERRPQSPSCRTPSRARVNFRRHPPSNYHDYRKYADELEDAEEVDTGHYRPSGDTFKVRDVMWDCQKLPTPKKRPPLMTSMSPRRHRKPSEDVLVTSVLVCSRCKRMSNLPEVYWKCRDVAFLCDDCLVSVSGHVDCDVDMCAVCMLAAEEIRRRMVVAENFLKGNLVLEET